MKEGTLLVSVPGLSSGSVSCQAANLHSRVALLNTKYYTTRGEVKRQRPPEGRYAGCSVKKATADSLH